MNFIIVWGKRWTVTISFMLLASVQTKAQKRDTLLMNGPSDEKLGNYYTWFEDPSQKLSVSSVYDSLQADRFLLDKGKRVFNRGFTRSAFWIAITLHNTTTGSLPIVWSFYNNNIELTLYDASLPRHITVIDSSSTDELLTERKFPVRNVSFKVVLKPNETRLLMVKAQTRGADNIYFPTDITTVEDYLLFEVNYSFLIGRYIGYFLFAFLFNILLGLALKRRIHLWHAAYVLAIIGFNLNEFMFDSLIFPGWFFHYWTLLPKSFFLLLPVYFGINVFQVFINQKDDFPLIYRVFKLFKVISLIVLGGILICCLLITCGQQVQSVWRMGAYYICFAGVILLLINMVVGLLKKHYYTIIYAISAIFLLYAFVDFILATLNFKHLFFVQPGNIIVAFTVEIIALTIFFVVKYRKEKNTSIGHLNEALTLRENWTKEIINVQESERQRVSRDLHDDLGATLATLKLHLSTRGEPGPGLGSIPGEYYDQSISLIKKATDDLRSISHNLVPQDFSEGGLFTILKNRVQQLNSHGAIKFLLVTEGEECKIGGYAAAISIYRIINELITNILKHSKATEATIQIAILDDEIQVVTEDNGIGMDNAVDKKGIGLSNIASRVEYLNGKVHIDSSSMGTTIIIKVPLNGI